MFRHTTEQIQEESAAIRYALNGLATGKGFPFQKTFYGKQFRKFFRTQDTTESIALALTEQHNGERTWVGALAEETRHTLVKTVEGAEDVALTNPIRKELMNVLEDQYGFMEKHGAIWRDAYEANYGQRSRKKKRAETARRGRGGRR